MLSCPSGELMYEGPPDLAPQEGIAVVEKFLAVKGYRVAPSPFPGEAPFDWFCEYGDLGAASTPQCPATSSDHTPWRRLGVAIRTAIRKDEP